MNHDNSRPSVANHPLEQHIPSSLYDTHDESVYIMKRHYIFLLHKVLRILFFLSISSALFALIYTYRTQIPEQLRYFGFLPLIFLLVNYCFFSLIFWVIEYYNSLVVLTGNRLYLINSTLLLRDDIEIVDLRKVTKVDMTRRGLLSNLLGYGDLVLEQQRDEVRVIHYVPDTYVFLDALNQVIYQIMSVKKQEEKNGETQDEHI